MPSHRVCVCAAEVCLAALRALVCTTFTLLSHVLLVDAEPVVKDVVNVTQQELLKALETRCLDLARGEVQPGQRQGKLPTHIPPCP